MKVALWACCISTIFCEPEFFEQRTPAQWDPGPGPGHFISVVAPSIPCYYNGIPMVERLAQLVLYKDPGLWLEPDPPGPV